MFVASSLYNYATGANKAGPSSAPFGDTRIKRHPKKKANGANGANGHASPPPSYAYVAEQPPSIHEVALDTDIEAEKSAARSAADRAKIAVVDEIVKQDDLYRILGVKRNAHADEIRRGFLNRSRMCHPDKLPSYAPCVVAFQKVSLAYQTLSKPSSRRMYDVSGRSDLASALNRDGGPNGSYPGSQFGGYDETLNSVLYSVFCEFLEGDFEMVRVLVNALNEGNPGLDLGEETADSIEGVFRKLREMLLAGKKYLTIIRFELIRLYEIQQSLRQLSYFDVFGRLRLTLQLARVTLSIPMAIDQAMKSDEDNEEHVGANGEASRQSHQWSGDAESDSSHDEDSSAASDTETGAQNLDFGMCADDSDDDNNDRDYGIKLGDNDLLYGETRRDRRKRLRRAQRRERIAARHRAKLEARDARANARHDRQLQKRGLLGPTAAGLLKGVVTVLETSEAWMPGGRQAGRTSGEGAAAAA